MSKRVSKFSESPPKRDKKKDNDLNDEFPLNEDCVRILIKYLPLQDLKSTRLSCKLLNRIVIEDGRFNMLAILFADFTSNIDVFRLSGTELTCNFKVKFPSLDETNKNLETQVIKFVENFGRRIEEVKLIDCSPCLIQKIVPELKMVKRLSICCKSVQIDKDYFSRLIYQNCSRLEVLELSDVFEVGQLTLRESLSHLTTLKLNRCRDVVISKLEPHITQLKKLYFSRSEYNVDKSLTKLINRNVGTLEALQLKEIDDGSLKGINRLPNIVHLKLTNCEPFDVTYILRRCARSLQQLTLNQMGGEIQFVYADIPLVNLHSLKVNEEEVDIDEGRFYQAGNLSELFDKIDTYSCMD